MAPSRNPLVRLEHRRREIDDLTRALNGTDFEAFADTYLLKRTTEHAILIISEAAKTLPPQLTDKHPNVDWRAVRDIGNVLRHDYFAVNAIVLWRIVQERLPELKIVVDLMIADLTR